MKKGIFALLCVVFFNTIVFSNDTYFFMVGGNLVPTTEADNIVEMKEETINIVLNDRYYEVTVVFNFYNPAETVDLSVGFPFFEIGIGGNGSIYDFHCWTNDEEIDYSDKPIERSWSKIPSDKPELENAFIRNILFKGKTFTTTKINYKADYGFDVDGLIANYLYGTGSSWKHSIGKITLIIENNIKYYRPVKITMGNNLINNTFTRISDNTFKSVFTNIEPDYEDIFQIFISDILDDTGPKRFPSYFIYTTKVVDSSRLFWYRKDQLRILRNTIYALHGYTFKSEDLKEIFTQWGQEWYPPYEENIYFKENQLTKIEKENVQIIYNEENKRILD